MSLIFYFHPVSQPSRAIHVALLMGKIKFDEKVIDIFTGAQKTPEYTTINPAQLVPAIQEGTFKLYESHAILRYLVNTRISLKFLYPFELQQQALVDCYLDWHQLGTRKIIKYLSDFFFGVKLLNKEAPPNQLERMKEMEEQLEFIENQFLGGEKKFKYIANQPNMTIADLSAHAEISSLLFINYDFSKYPNIQAWYENMTKIPELKQAYTIHNDMVKQFNPELNDYNQRVI